MDSHVLERPIRAGVFHEVDQVRQVTERLLAAGFTKEQITVVCSDQEKEQHFRDYEHQEPAGYYTLGAIAAGAISGATICGMFGLIIVLATSATGGVAIVPLVAVTGAVVGGFVGAMLTQLVEKELANFYDQEVMPGEFLVAAEDHSDRAEKSLAEAQRILSEAGAKALELPEG